MTMPTATPCAKSHASWLDNGATTISSSSTMMLFMFITFQAVETMKPGFRRALCESTRLRAERNDDEDANCNAEEAGFGARGNHCFHLFDHQHVSILLSCICTAQILSVGSSWEPC